MTITNDDWHVASVNRHEASCMIMAHELGQAKQKPDPAPARLFDPLNELKLENTRWAMN